MQDYSWRDVTVAAVAGATNAIDRYGRYISGAITGVYTAYTSYSNGVDLIGALLSGVAAGTATTFSMGNLAEILGGSIDLSTSVLSDLTFGVGFNISAAVVKKAAVDIGNYDQNSDNTGPRLILLIKHQREILMGGVSDAMIIKADKEYKIHALFYFCVLVFNLILLFSISCPIPIILSVTFILVIFWIQFCILVGRELVFGQCGCTIRFLFITRHYRWNEIKIIEIEDYTNHLKPRQIYKRGVYFSIRNIRKPKWIMPADYSLFVNQFKFFSCILIQK